MIEHARNRAARIADTIDRIGNPTTRNRYLLQNFLVGSPESYFSREVASHYFFDEVNRYMIGVGETSAGIYQLLSLLVVCVYVALMVLCVIWVGSQMDAQTTQLWGYVLVALIVTDVLFYEPLKLMVYMLVVSSVLRRTILPRLVALRDISRLVMMRKEGTVRDAASCLVQRQNIACRAARLCPELTISRLLISFNDEDMAYIDRNTGTGMPLQPTIRGLLVVVKVAKCIIESTAAMPSFIRDGFIQATGAAILYSMITALIALGVIHIALPIVIVSASLMILLLGMLHRRCKDTSLPSLQLRLKPRKASQDSLFIDIVGASIPKTRRDSVVAPVDSDDLMGDNSECATPPTTARRFKMSRASSKLSPPPPTIITNTYRDSDTGSYRPVYYRQELRARIELQQRASSARSGSGGLFFDWRRTVNHATSHGAPVSAANPPSTESSGLVRRKTASPTNRDASGADGSNNHLYNNSNNSAWRLSKGENSGFQPPLESVIDVDIASIDAIEFVSPPWLRDHRLQERLRSPPSKGASGLDILEFYEQQVCPPKYSTEEGRKAPSTIAIAHIDSAGYESSSSVGEIAPMGLQHTAMDEGKGVQSILKPKGSRYGISEATTTSALLAAILEDATRNRDATTSFSKNIMRGVTFADSSEGVANYEESASAASNSSKEVVFTRQSLDDVLRRISNGRN
jgi:hypothetical protein